MIHTTDIYFFAFHMILGTVFRESLNNSVDVMIEVPIV